MYKRSFCKYQLEEYVRSRPIYPHIIHRDLHRDVTVYAMHICCNTEYNNALFTIPHIREKKRENSMQRGKRRKQANNRTQSNDKYI